MKDLQDTTGMGALVHRKESWFRGITFGFVLLTVCGGWLSPAPAHSREKAQTQIERDDREASRDGVDSNGSPRLGEPTGPIPPTPPYEPTPGSLFLSGASYVDLVSDLRAREVGDLVTIRIIESTRASQSAETDTSRDASVSGGIDNLFGLENFIPDDINLAALIAGSTSRSFSGGGENSRTNSLTTTLTARVIDVLPNRSLVVEATRLVRVNGEEESITLRGVLRPYDISATNVALSTALADVQILYGGKGVIGSNLKPGFLMRLVQFLF